MQDKNRKTYKVYQCERVLRVVIPKAIAHAHGIKKGDKVEWVINRYGELVMRTVEHESR